MYASLQKRICQSISWLSKKERKAVATWGVIILQKMNVFWESKCILREQTESMNFSYMLNTKKLIVYHGLNFLNNKMLNCREIVCIASKISTKDKSDPGVSCRIFSQLLYSDIVYSDHYIAYSCLPKYLIRNI